MLEDLFFIGLFSLVPPVSGHLAVASNIWGAVVQRELSCGIEGTCSVLVLCCS